MTWAVGPSRPAPATTHRTSVDKSDAASLGKLPQQLGLAITDVEDCRVAGRFAVRPDLVSRKGHLLASVGPTVADLPCAYGAPTISPEGARSFTGVEATWIFVGTALEGAGEGAASLVHGGRTTQLWDAEITSAPAGRRMAESRATHVILH